MALAYRAGVPLKDMEFVQDHPTGLPNTGILLTEACRGEGGVLLNKHGRRFLQDYGMGPETPLGKPQLKTMEWVRGTGSAKLSGRKSAKATCWRRSGGRACCSTCATSGEKIIDERLPFVRELSTSYLNVDPVTHAVPVRPVVHYMMGGIHTDLKAATPLPGLYAAGECACVSINGANRLGSNSLVEILVFGTPGRACQHDRIHAVRREPEGPCSCAPCGCCKSRLRELFNRARERKRSPGCARR